MGKIDYAASAELYLSKSFYKSRQVRYRRFESVAEAVRYAMEDMPAEMLRGSLIETGDQRFEGPQIRALYADDAYPLARREADL